MALGRRPTDHQGELFVTSADLPRSAGHPFYDRLNRLLAGHGFDAYVEDLCRPYYADGQGRPGIPPGVYFRMLFVGYFEGIDSQRGIAWRCSDSLALRSFLGTPLTEATPPGDDFLARLCVEWEDAAKPAARRGVRVVLLRTGLVLEKSGGTLAKMITPFRWFAGGPLGSGRQYMSWIHRLDWIEMVRWIVQSPSVDGPVNATSPHPVTNAAFAKALGRALHRPAVLPAPAFALRLALGELADALLIGQRAIPARARQGGFHFRYPEIDLALRGIFGE